MSRPVALITGASSGIGRASAIALAEAGFDLAVSARRSGELDSLAGELTQQGHPQVHCRPADLADLEDASSLVNEVLDHFGRLDVLVNNAGLTERAMLGDMTLGVLQRSMVLNAFAPSTLVTKAWEALAASPQGIVINISSVSTIDPLPGLGAYGMSKLAIEGLTRSIQVESSASNAGIRAIAVAPGAVDTPMLREAVGDMVLPDGAMVPMSQLVEVILECIRGGHDAADGGVLYVPGPGVVTQDRAVALSTLVSIWGD